MLLDSSSSLSYMLFFTYSFYINHLYLHSFPTRRSSDLLSQTMPIIRKAIGPLLILIGLFMIGLFQWKKTWQIFNIPTKIFKEDRKSTRLNSSHVAISYAVFCLKKKI